MHEIAQNIMQAITASETDLLVMNQHPLLKAKFVRKIRDSFPICKPIFPAFGFPPPGGYVHCHDLLPPHLALRHAAPKG